MLRKLQWISKEKNHFTKLSPTGAIRSSGAWSFSNI